MTISDKITNILNYYKENPGCDPNVYEFIGLCHEMVQYLNIAAPNYGIHYSSSGGPDSRQLTTPQTYPIPRAIYEKFCILNQYFQEKLLGNNLGITRDSTLYTLYENVSRGVGTYSAYPDNELLQKLGGVSLFIAQQKRDNPNFVYDNGAELEQIKELDGKLHDPHGAGHWQGPDKDNMEYVEPNSPRRKLIEEITTEYNKQFPTNDVPTEEIDMTIPNKIDAILNYYKENPGCDPNVHEFFGLCHDMVAFLSKYAPTYGIHSTSDHTKEQARELYPIPCATFDKFQELKEQFNEKLLGNDLGFDSESPIAKVSSELTQGVGTYSGFEDTPLKQMLGGVTLFIAQQRRENPDFIYDNEDEMNRMRELQDEYHDPVQNHLSNGELVEGSPRQELFNQVLEEFNKGQKTA